MVMPSRASVTMTSRDGARGHAAERVRPPVGAGEHDDAAAQVARQEREVLEEGAPRGDGAQVQRPAGIAEQVGGGLEGPRVESRVRRGLIEPRRTLSSLRKTFSS